MKEKISKIIFKAIFKWGSWEDPEDIVDIDKTANQATDQILAEFKKIVPEKKDYSKGKHDWVDVGEDKGHNNCIDIINGRLE